MSQPADPMRDPACCVCGVTIERATLDEKTRGKSADVPWVCSLWCMLNVYKEDLQRAKDSDS